MSENDDRLNELRDRARSNMVANFERLAHVIKTASLSLHSIETLKNAQLDTIFMVLEEMEEEGKTVYNPDQFVEKLVERVHRIDELEEAEIEDRFFNNGSD